MKLYKNLPEITVMNGKKPIRAVVIEDSSPEDSAKGWVRIAKIGASGNLSRKSWLVMKSDYKLRGRADQNRWSAPIIYNDDKTIGIDSDSLTKLDSIMSCHNNLEVKQ
tara:strand:+ start:56 stop:379 length:324 start_codon:yes stop_codon:yes gene_type:complete